MIKEKFRSYYIYLAKGKRKGALDAFFFFLLLLPSFVYAVFVKLILFCYQTGLLKSYRPGCRTISVGNIVWGGSGKTPLVEAIAKYFKQQGRNPAVLIRGYGEDETRMLKSKLKDIPVLPGRDRIATAKQAQGLQATDTIILDDGFQHWRLERDLDIVLIDASCPFGNGRLIPAGMLREPLSSLKRADVFVLTRLKLAKEKVEQLKEKLRKYNPRAPIYEAIHLPASLYSLTSGEKRELSAVNKQRIALVCAIGNPESFKETLDSLGAKAVLKFYFRDHHRYTKQDLQRIEKECLENRVGTIITTEKDVPKLTALLNSGKFNLELLALGVEFKIIEGEKRFYRYLHAEKNYSILVLSDGRAGHLNQSKTISRIIQEIKLRQGRRLDEISTEIIEVKFRNRFYRMLLAAAAVFSGVGCRQCLYCVRLCLQKDSFKQLVAVPADIIVSAGSSLSCLNLFLGFKNQARKVVLMKPSFLSLDRFDLVIAPEHDRLKQRDNVVVTKIAPNLINQHYLQEQSKALDAQYAIRHRQYGQKGPTIGLLIGGDSPKYRIGAELMEKIIFQLKQATKNLDAQLLVTTSRRTSCDAEKILKDNLANFSQCRLLIIANEKNIPEAVGGILGLSDIVVVSGESISMVSEALSAQKYVLIFESTKKGKGLTRQERFLKNLKRENLVRIVRSDKLALEIEDLWKRRPPVKKIEDQDLIYQALGRIA